MQNMIPASSMERESFDCDFTCILNNQNLGSRLSCEVIYIYRLSCEVIKKRGQLLITFALLLEHRMDVSMEQLRAEMNWRRKKEV